LEQRIGGAPQVADQQIDPSLNKRRLAELA
jgi:hypothetical protein